MDDKALTPSQKSSIHVKSPQFKILKTSLDVDICSAPMVGISLIQPPSCRDVLCVFLNMFLQKNNSALYFRYWTILVSGHLVFPGPVFNFLDKFSFKQEENWGRGGEVEKRRTYSEADHLCKGSPQLTFVLLPWKHSTTWQMRWVTPAPSGFVYSGRTTGKKLYFPKLVSSFANDD